MTNATLPTPAATSVACDHCGLPVPETLREAGAEHQFCCGGCAVAFEAIRGCGLESYYTVRDQTAGRRQAAKGANKAYASYDFDAFQSRHVTATGSGFRAIELRLEGVHCAACVWLVERLPSVLPGVIEARLSLSSSRLRVVWDPEKVSLSKVASTLDRFGYAPHPARDASAHQARAKAERGRLVNMAIAGALAGNNMLIAVALYAGVFDGMEPQFARLFRWLSMVIGWGSLAWPGATFFSGAVAAWRARVANLDQPIALALGVGAIASTVNVLTDRGEVYFDSLSTLVFLLLVGRYLQARQQRWAEEAVGLTLSMTPDSCRVVRDGAVFEESSDALEPGDTVEVRPGDLMPADGTVASGVSAMDQSLLTGESRPVPVGVGDPVYGGALNVASTVRVRVAAVGEATRVGKLIRLVEEGLAKKPSIVQFADRVAGWFVIGVTALALANLVWWSATAGLAPAIQSTVALLIVACPCALGLATPLTMAVAVGRGARAGMLIKGPSVLERLAVVSPASPGRLFLDKTGTLTSGRLSIDRWIGDESLRRWVAAVESESPHPVGRALAKAYGDVDPRDLARVSQRTEHHGHGVCASIPSGEILIGSPRFAEEQGAEADLAIGRRLCEAQKSPLTVVVVAIDGRVLAAVTLRDELHGDSRERIAWLRRNGWKTEICSGDATGPVRDVAERVGLTAASAHAAVTPEGKLQRVQEATAGPDHPTVMMVGDGVNDAAALAAADVGVAVKGGAEASLAAADVYLREPGIGKLTELVRLGRDTMRVARRNLAISITYNAAAVTLAACGWVTPLVAAVLMPLSSLSVLGSAVAFAAPRALDSSKPPG